MESEVRPRSISGADNTRAAARAAPASRTCNAACSGPLASLNRPHHRYHAELSRATRSLPAACRGGPNPCQGADRPFPFLRPEKAAGCRRRTSWNPLHAQPQGKGPVDRCLLPFPA